MTHLPSMSLKSCTDKLTNRPAMQSLTKICGTYDKIFINNTIKEFNSRKLKLIDKKLTSHLICSFNNSSGLQFARNFCNSRKRCFGGTAESTTVSHLDVLFTSSLLSDKGASYLDN